MHLGKDFWRILDVFRFIAKIIEFIAKDVNEDTPPGEEKDPATP